MEKIILTEQGKLELENRLKELRNQLIPDVVQRIKVAREQGDLSENAEYHAARDEQGKLVGEAEEIENKLKYAEIVYASDSDVVEVGKKVKLLDMDENEELVYTIVGTAEADLNKNKISVESAVGQAINGKKPGDVVVVKPPKFADYKIKILEILD